VATANKQRKAERRLLQRYSIWGKLAQHLQTMTRQVQRIGFCNPDSIGQKKAALVGEIGDESLLTYNARIITDRQ